jgi:hypothetical protein
MKQKMTPKTTNAALRYFSLLSAFMPFPPSCLDAAASAEFFD